jgi:transposase-like protein
LQPKKQKRRIVEKSSRPGTAVVSIVRAFGVLACQIFDWRRAFEEVRPASEASAPSLLSVLLSDLFYRTRSYLHGV